MNFRYIASVLVLFSSVGLVQAQINTWSGGGTDDFFTNSANWSLGSVPTGSSDVRYNNSDNNGTTDLVGASQTVGTFSFNNGTHTFQNGSIGVTTQSNTNFSISGGTFVYGSNDVIASGTLVRFAGGTIALNGNSQTSGSALGTLRLVNVQSTISYGAGVQTINFADILQVNGGTLLITGWGGQENTSNVGGNTIFAAPGSVDSTTLANIQFAGFGMGAIQLGSGEIVAAPEPASILAVAGLGMIGVRSLRRRMKETAPEAMAV